MFSICVCPLLDHKEDPQDKFGFSFFIQLFALNLDLRWFHHFMTFS